MRLTITFQSPDLSSCIKLPLHYNYALQGFIYNHISSHLAEFLHNRGYSFERRVFKLFTFSRIFGRYRLDKEKRLISFSSPVKFQLSSPLDDFIQEFAETLARSPDVSLEGNSLVVSSIEVHFSPHIRSPVIIKMLSPLTCYSTFLTGEGKKKTYYFSPLRKNFPGLLKKILLKNMWLFIRKNPPRKILISYL